MSSRAALPLAPRDDRPPGNNESRALQFMKIATRKKRIGHACDRTGMRRGQGGAEPFAGPHLPSHSPKT